MASKLKIVIPVVLYLFVRHPEPVVRSYRIVDGNISEERVVLSGR